MLVFLSLLRAGVQPTLDPSAETVSRSNVLLYVGHSGQKLLATPVRAVSFKSETSVVAGPFITAICTVAFTITSPAHVNTLIIGTPVETGSRTALTS